jgi:nucleoside-diphosphate-sugar epimerase
MDAGNAWTSPRCAPFGGHLADWEGALGSPEGVMEKLSAQCTEGMMPSLRDHSMLWTPRPLLLLGASGQLGSSLLRKFRQDPGSFPQIEHIPWTELEPLMGRPIDLRGLLDRRVAGLGRCDVVFALGNTNPAIAPEALMASNLHIVQRVVEVLDPLPRFLTFGSIQEHFPDLCKTNPYLRSKLDLGAWMQAQGGLERFLHLRLHTLYGGVGKAHMFLGQVLHSLRSNEPFRMSSGDQLREYHHVDDISEAVARLLASAWMSGPTLDINSGVPVSLASLAQAVFSHFGKPELLSIGTLPRQASENIHRVFPRTPEGILPRSREPVAGVIQWLEECLAGS